MKLIRNNVNLLRLRGVSLGRTLSHFGIDIGVMEVPHMLVAGDGESLIYRYLRYRQLKSEREIEIKY
jgi:hypothetical protein